MATEYSRASPYYNTPKSGNFLDLWVPRNIPMRSTDTYYEIDSFYDLRPDMMAYDLYKNSGLWWVFAVRNPDVIKDPIFDFRTGTRIFVPDVATVTEALGV